MTQDANRNALWARAIAEELARSGVRDVCASPGSRSTPLTLAAAAHPDLRLTMHIDERSASFFALGTALRTGRPAALVCTSGTAGAHYLPAVIEARYSRVPLVVLTADRPAELMHAGAGQTIDQVHLFGDHARAFVHADLPVTEPLALRHLRATVDRLVATARGDVGPGAGAVHLNVPFREPLAPIPVPGDVDPELYAREPLAMHGRGDAPLIQYAADAPTPSASTLDAIAAALDASSRPVICVGPLPSTTQPDDLKSVLALSEVSGAPIMADPVSQLRFTEHGGATVLTRYDAFLRSADWRRAHAPDVVVRFGASLTSKVHRFWRQEHLAARELLVDPDGLLHDEVQHAELVAVGAPGVVARGVAARITRDHSSSEWVAALTDAERTADGVFSSALPEGPLWEAPLARAVVDAMGSGDTLMLASSMPIRDADAFSGARAIGARVVSNRGANGIDGLTSTALGLASRTPDAHTWAVIGDVAFLHDVGGLFAARGAGVDLDATIVVPNNSGGGIFHYLPIASHDEVDFERLFATAHDTQLAHLARAYGVEHALVRTRDELAAALAASREAGGVRVVEAVIDREDNVARHKAAWAEVSARLATEVER